MVPCIYTLEHRKGSDPMNLPFVLYAGIIPVVPLIGVEIFKRRKDQLRRDICYALFGLQLFLSIASIFLYHS